MPASLGTFEVPVLSALPGTGVAGQMCYVSGQQYFSNGTSWVPAFGQTLHSVNLGSDLALTASTITTVLTSSNLSVGTYLVSAGLTVSGTGSCEMNFAQGTATIAFSGNQSAAVSGLSSTVDSMSITGFAVVSVAGTMLVRAESVGTITLKATTPIQGFSKACGSTQSLVRVP